MLSVYEVDAKALKKIEENNDELSFLIYLEALGFVTAKVSENKQELSRMIRFNETEIEEYEKGLELLVSGEYDFNSRRLDIFDYVIQKDA